MIRLILFLVVAVALSLLATWFADHPGRVSLVWQGMRIETSFAILVVGLVLFGVVVTIVFEVLRLIRGAPKRFVRGRRRVRTEKGYRALSQGLVAVAAGDTAGAKASRRRAEKLLDRTPATLLLSAQTAQLDGDESTARVKFQQMLRHTETEFLGLRGLLAQAIKDGDTANALELARRAYLRRPNTPWVLTTLFDLQTRAELWSEALHTVADMARHKLIDRTTANRRRAILLHQQAAEARKAGRPYDALWLARKAHKLLPSLAPLAIQASELAEQTSQPRLARKILETAWGAQPHPSLAKAYLALAGEQPAGERLKLAERLYHLEPAHLESDLMLAEQAIAAKQWSTARTALESARKREPTASVYRLLAEVEQAEGEAREGARLARQGGRRATGSRLVVFDHRRNARHLVGVRPGRPLRQSTLGLAAEDRAAVAPGCRSATDPASDGPGPCGRRQHGRWTRPERRGWARRAARRRGGHGRRLRRAARQPRSRGRARGGALTACCPLAYKPRTRPRRPE